MKKGYDVRTTETIGMAQRGGSVFGHVRIGAGGMGCGANIFSPLIPLGKVDVIIAFEPAEAVRQMTYLRDNGVVLACDSAVKPTADPKGSSYEAAAVIDFLKSHAPRSILLDGKRLTARNAKTLNVALLGAAAQSGILPFDADTLMETLYEVLPQRLLEMNIKAFELGKELCP